MATQADLDQLVCQQIIKKVCSPETQTRMVDFWNEYVRDTDLEGDQCIYSTDNINYALSDLNPAEILAIGQSSSFNLKDRFFQKKMNDFGDVVSVWSSNEPGFFMNFYDLANYALKEPFTAERYGLDMHYVRRATHQINVPKTIYEQLCEKGEQDEQVVDLWNRYCETKEIDSQSIDMTMLHEFCFEHLDRWAIQDYGLNGDYLDNYITDQVHALTEDEYKAVVNLYEAEHGSKSKGDDYISEWLRDDEKGQVVAGKFGIELASDALTFKTPEFLQRLAGLPVLEPQHSYDQSMSQAKALEAKSGVHKAHRR